MDPGGVGKLSAGLGSKAVSEFRRADHAEVRFEGDHAVAEKQLAFEAFEQVLRRRLWQVLERSISTKKGFHYWPRSDGLALMTRTGLKEASLPPSSQPHMIWIAPSEKDTATTTLEKRLWEAADHFQANSGLKSRKSSAPVLRVMLDQDPFGRNESLLSHAC